MATLLDEPNVERLARVIEVLGPARAEALLDDTLRLAADGGVLVDNQSRWSTPGGVFFYLTRRTLPAASRRQIFPEAMTAPRLAPVPRISGMMSMRWWAHRRRTPEEKPR